MTDSFLSSERSRRIPVAPAQTTRERCSTSIRLTLCCPVPHNDQSGCIPTSALLRNSPCCLSKGRDLIGYCCSALPALMAQECRWFLFGSLPQQRYSIGS